jgi:protein phosphatase
MAEVEVGAATDTGVVREQNEDAVARWDDSTPHLDTNGRLFALADGMGGHSRGEVASNEALRIIVERYYREPVSDITLALKQAIRAANEHLYLDGAAKGPEHLMGTTLVAGVVQRNLLTIANVGDSRAYIVRAKGITQITSDHSVVAEQVARGMLTAEEARTSRNRNVITRALGQQPRVEPDIFEVPLLPADAIVLASDGLYHAFTEAELAQLAVQGSPAAAAAEMVRIASERESNDNASAVIIHFDRQPVTAAAGRNLFDTAELPTPEVAGGRRVAGWLVGVAVAAALVIVIVLVLLYSGLLTLAPVG